MLVDMITTRIDTRQYEIREICGTMQVMSSSPTLQGRIQALCCSPIDAAPLAHDDAVELAAVMKALADPVRLQLVSIIAAAGDGEVCACDLPELVDRKQSTVSHHLSQLTKAGLIKRDQRGKWAWFRIEPQCLDAIAGFLRCGPEAGCS